MRLSSPIGINQSVPVGRMRNGRSTICLSCVLLFATLSLISANDNEAIGAGAVSETIGIGDSPFPSDRANPSDDPGSVQSVQTSTEETILSKATTILDDTNASNNELERREKMPDARGLSVSDINDITLENIKEKDAGEAIKLPKRHTIGWLPDEFPDTQLQSCSCSEEALNFGHEYRLGVIIHEIFCEANKLLHYLVLAGKNLKFEFLPKLPLPFNVAEGEAKNVFSLRNILLGETLFEIVEQSLGGLQVFLEDSENLLLLFDRIRKCIPLSSIRETLAVLRIAIKKFFSHIRGFAIDLGPHFGISVNMDILGELGEVIVVAEEILLKFFYEYSPSSLEGWMNLLSEVVSMLELLFEKLSNPEWFYRFAVLLKTFAYTVHGFYCGFYASGFPQSIGFAPSFIGNFFLNTCKAPIAENGEGPSSLVTVVPDIPDVTWMGQKTNGQNDCPIFPDISSVNVGMQSSIPQSVIARLEASAKHSQYQRSHDYLVSNVRNGITNRFPFQPKWSVNNAEPSSLDSSLTNNPTFNEPFQSLNLLSAPLQQATPPPPLPIPTDMSPLSHEPSPSPSDLSRPDALPPYKNSAADKYDQLLPDAPATETYDDPSEFTYSPPSEAIQNSQDEGNSDPVIPLLPPLPLFPGGASVENGSSVDSIDTPQSESSDTTPRNVSTLLSIAQQKAHQPILQSLLSVPQVGTFQRDSSAQASETPLETEASQPSSRVTNAFLNLPEKVAYFYKHLYPQLQRLQHGNSGSALSPNTAEKKLANPCGTVASLPAVSELNNVLKGVAGLQFPLEFPRNEISSALGNVALTPGDAVIIIPTNGLVLIGRVVDTVSQISFNVYKLKSMSTSSQGRAKIWHLRFRDMRNPICEQQLQLLSQS
ncbi:uncharacterized protein LOC143372848 isoform X2 [Andrena cerasifolii]|uniref:uncharacterized protein LOC143372848 isoform X2 n=1 Tax=Andrena cerasifolii TaxID=2819439 RepID=UPI0040382DC1